ncbi:TPA: hypothetical protein OBS79_000626 [Escherichia coli]|nr:hypothetical protein [Escherichia coli]
MGHILKLVNDARLLIERSSYNSALILLLTAIDSSAAKIYPKGCKSFYNPKSEMNHRERYVRFLSARLSEIFGRSPSDDVHLQPVIKDIGNERVSPANVIYKVFRNSAIHEGKIPDEVRSVFDSCAADKISLEMSEDRISFSSGFLSLLICVVVMAPTNGVEFSINHYRIKPVDGVSLENYLERFKISYNLTPVRVYGIINTILDIGPDAYHIDDCRLAIMFNSAVHPGTKTGLCFSATEEPIFTFDHGITSYGVKVVRDIMKGLEIYDIAS